MKHKNYGKEEKPITTLFENILFWQIISIIITRSANYIIRLWPVRKSLRLNIRIVMLISIAVFEAAEQARENQRLAELRTESVEHDLESQKQLAAAIPPESLIVCGRLTLNTAVKQAFLINQDLGLKEKEFDLLAFFIERENETVNLDETYQAVWKQPYLSTDHRILC